MADDNALFAIEVDADDYAGTAAGDTPAVSRTHQNESTFQTIKATYSAKIDGGTAHADLIAAVPALSEPGDVAEHGDPSRNNLAANGEGLKVRLSKKDIQLLNYAVGELYYARHYEGVVRLCGRVREVCEVDGKTEESLGRWMRRCAEGMGEER